MKFFDLNKFEINLYELYGERLIMSRKIVRPNSTILIYVTKILHLFYKYIILQKAIEKEYKICYILITGCDICFISIEKRENENK